jgi:hypothetical protein
VTSEGVTRPEPADTGDLADQLRGGEWSDPVDLAKVRCCGPMDGVR